MSPSLRTGRGVLTLSFLTRTFRVDMAVRDGRTAQSQRKNRKKNGSGHTQWCPTFTFAFSSIKTVVDGDVLMAVLSLDDEVTLRMFCRAKNFCRPLSANAAASDVVRWAWHVLLRCISMERYFSLSWTTFSSCLVRWNVGLHLAQRGLKRRNVSRDRRYSIKPIS